MHRAFWAFAPATDGRDDKWFFDKSVWQKMFRTMNGCGFNCLFFFNDHPFATMIDISAYPNERVIEDAAAVDYRQMYHWILEAALDYDIAPYLAFEVGEPDPDFLHNCMHALLDDYPVLRGLVICGLGGSLAVDLTQAGIVDVLDAVRPDASLHLQYSDNSANMAKITRRGSRKIGYLVKYTHDHLVDENPDEQFTDRIDEVGAENIIAEFGFANYEPTTSFSFDTVGGVLANLEHMGCEGLAVKPLSPTQWPLVSDTYFKYQWQRDLVWYSVWGGSSIEKLKKQGSPKWLVRNPRLVIGFEAASRVLEILSLYFAGDRSSGFRPQYCSLDTANGPHLISIADILRPQDISEYSGRDWWQEITGDPAVYLAEYIHRGAPENTYGPEELIEELNDLSHLAVAAGEKGMRSASGEKELPSLSRDAFCMGRLGEFYVERLRAALSYARHENTEAAEHAARALGLYRELAAVDSTHRDKFTLRWRYSSVSGSWESIISALEREYEDILKGDFKPGLAYPIS